VKELILTYSDFTPRLLQSGASGAVTSLAGMQLLTDNLIRKDFSNVDSSEEDPQASYSFCWDAGRC
jgi:hypothetical protein